MQVHDHFHIVRLKYNVGSGVCVYIIDIQLKISGSLVTLKDKMCLSLFISC